MPASERDSNCGSTTGARYCSQVLVAAPWSKEAFTCQSSHEVAAGRRKSAYRPAGVS